MAGGTMSFFNRIFSSKKKNASEQEPEIGGVQNHDSSESSSVGADDKKAGLERQSMEPSVEKPNDNNGLEVDHSTSLYIENKASHQLSGTDTVESRSAESNADAVNTESAVATAATTGHYSNTEKETTYNENYKEFQEPIQSGNQSHDDSSSNDSALEMESFILLSKLEQFTIKLSDESVQKSASMVVEYLVGIANEVVEFAGQLPGADQRKSSLQALFGRDAKSYNVLGVKFVENDRLVINDSVINESDNSNQIFINLTNDLLHLTNVYLGACVKAFKSEQMSEQWKTMYKGFLKTLSESVRSSQSNQQN